MTTKQRVLISVVVVTLILGLTVQVGAADDLVKAIETGDTDEVKNLTTGFFDVDVNSSNERGGTVLMVATLRENVEAVKILLSEGAKVDTKSKEGATSLMLAAGKGNSELVELLLENGADINATCDRGWTALDLAKYFNHDQVIKILKENI
ncbi:MAG: ankyrin repeat domain-containing protein [Bacillota bacterium]